MSADRQQTRRDAAALRLVPDLPRCPHCGSRRLKTFDPDWIEAPKGSWECVDCGNAFVPGAWR